MSRVVRILCYPGIQPLDVVGPHEVFAGATRHLQDQRPDMPGYRTELVSSGDTTVISESGLALIAGRGIDECVDHGDVDTLVVPGGLGVYDARDDVRLIAWVRAAATAARRVAAVCTGAFLLAEAGLLDGCRVTTHWARAERLQREYPALDVDADPVYIHARGVWTSAGVTAGTDLALALVEADRTVDIARRCGLGTAETLRRAFIRHLGVPPSAYRERFAVASPQKGTS